MRRTKKQPSDMDIYVGGRVRALRQVKGMSQTDLGKELGVTFQQVQKYEKGTNRLSAGRLSQMAELFGVAISAFYPADGLQARAHPGGKNIRVTDDPFFQMSQIGRGIDLARAFITLTSEHQSVVVIVAQALAGDG
jgi:transcriptional regulator with XRE-family HTH domain